MPRKTKLQHHNTSNPPLAEQINTLLNDTFGSPYLSPADIHHYMLDPHSTVITSSHRKTILGVAIAITVPTTEPLTNKAHNAEQLLKLVPELETQPAIYLHSVAIHPSHQKQGLGTRLVSELLTWAQTQQPTLIFVQGWKDAHGCHIEKIMNSHNFTNRGELTEPYLTESLNNPDYRCSTCGNPCYCTEIIFTRSNP